MKYFKLCPLVLSLLLPAMASAELPYFFTVRKGSSVSFLLGTVHSGVSLAQLSAAVPRCLMKANRVFAEIDKGQGLDSKEDPNSFHYIARLQKPSSISHLGKLRLLTMGLPLEYVWTRSEFTCAEIWIRYSEFWRVPKMDVELLELSSKMQLPITALDSQELRNEAARLDGLDESLVSPDSKSCKTEFMTATGSLSLHPTLVSQYLKGQIEIPDFESSSPGMVLRNREWKMSLVPAFTEGGAFVLVGYAHLVGREGLLRHLREAGFEVEMATSLECL